jgi:ANTAR domain
MSATAHNSWGPAGTAVEDLESLVGKLQGEVSGLRVAMASRATIEQAKGMLMLRYKIDEDRAFQLLKRWSSVSNVKLRVIAAALIEGGLTELTLVDSDRAPSHLLTPALARHSRETQRRPGGHGEGTPGTEERRNAG